MLKVEGLSCRRGGLPVLEGVGFSVGAGEALVLRGPNGIGKTTLLRTLAGLQPPLSGSIEMPEGEGAYASHADGVKSALTVRENLAFWAEVHESGADLDAVLARFDLAPLARRFGAALSAGQKRRLGLARLAVTGRRLLLLDEPTVSLDKSSVAMFAGWLTEHLGQGGAALIATHIDLGLDAPELDLTPYRATSDRVGAADEAFL